MKQTIIDFLKSHKSVKRADLLKHINALGYNITDRLLRATVEVLIVKDDFCIRSGNDGYSLITNKAEFDEAVAYLDAKASAIAVRKNCLIRNYREEIKQEQP